MFPRQFSDFPPETIDYLAFTDGANESTIIRMRIYIAAKACWRGRSSHTCSSLIGLCGRPEGPLPESPTAALARDPPGLIGRNALLTRSFRTAGWIIRAIRSIATADMAQYVNL